jgi:hypothetical protein
LQLIATGSLEDREYVDDRTDDLAALHADAHHDVSSLLLPRYDHCEVSFNLDDSFEFFGGTVNVKSMLSVLFAGDAAFDTAFTALATLATLAALAALATPTLAARPANRSAPARALRPRGGGDHSDVQGKGDDLLLLAASPVRAIQSGDIHGEQSNMSFRRAPYYVDPQGHTLQTREVTIGNAISKAVFNEKRNGIGDFAGMQPEIRTAFGPGSWKPDTCYQEMKGAVESFTDLELPLVAALAHDGTGIKVDLQTRFSIPVLKERLGQLSWYKQANLALARVKDATSNFMAGQPKVEARELKLDQAKWSALFAKAPQRFVSLSTAAESSAKLPHNSSTQELTQFLRDHGEGEHLDRLVGIPPESEGDQTARAKHEDRRHRETEYDHRLATSSERDRAARATKISNGVTDLQIPEDVGNLDQLIINVLLKPRIATRAACITYESIQPANKGQNIKIVLQEILTAEELTSLTKLVDKMNTNFLSCRKSMSLLMWTLASCLHQLVSKKAASQAQEAWKGLLTNKTQQLLMLGKALLKEEHALTKEVEEELQKKISAVEVGAIFAKSAM